MTQRRRAMWAIVALLVAWPVTGADVRQDLVQKATWTAPRDDQVRQAAFQWLDGQHADAATRERVEAAWRADGTLFDHVVATLAAGDPQARDLIAQCSKARVATTLPDAAWLMDEKIPAFERDNLRLLYGRWLAQQELYDEALEPLTGLKPQDVVEPATLLFYQGVVQQRMLNREAGLEAIDRLLERSDIPHRFTSVARLMQADLMGLKEESLDHIARQMDDVRRRLDLGRAGPKVRHVEDDVIAALDKLIDQMEKQQQAAASSAGGQGSIRSSSPAPDSRILGGKGPGEVTKKNIGNKSGWGDLPPKERQETLQQIGKDFPAHYRDVIEQYFRKLATDTKDK